MAKLLIVDDEQKIREVIQEYAIRRRTAWTQLSCAGTRILI